MSPSPVKRHPVRRLGWLGGTALGVLAPKCFACLAAYLGLGALIGLRAAPEICGAAPSRFPLFAVFWFAAVIATGWWLGQRGAMR